MTTVNNYLLNLTSQAPALLRIGADRTENYNQLAALTGGLGSGESNPWSVLSAAGGAQDQVSLAYGRIGERIITDLAALTAEAIKKDPSLDGDYVIALIDGPTGQEARVYRRSEILAGFEGTAEEKSALEAQLAANPLAVFSDAQGLPETSGDPATQTLADEINGFLKNTSKTLNALKNAGADPFLNMRDSWGPRPDLTGLDAAAEA